MNAMLQLENDVNSRPASMQLLTRLRWIAVAGQIITIAFVHFVVMITLPLHEMLEVIAFLVGYNLFSIIHWRVLRGPSHREVSDADLFLSLMMDVLALTAQLYLSGGANNPFIFLFLLQVILGSMMLQTWSLWALIAVSTACFSALTVFYHPLTLPPHDTYLKATLFCYAINAVLIALFVTHLHRMQRARDARLASLRQRAVEEEHIVRMGLLASGAAHELSTPLSTLAVILGDWKHLPSFKADTEVLQEIDEMQRQVQRCKSIVTGILLSSGEARGEALMETTVHNFLDALIFERRETRPGIHLDYENTFGEDVEIVSDSVLKQAIVNILDNAQEASPHWLKLGATRRNDELILSVVDNGPGFSEEMLERIGKPYQSTKPGPSRGLGLFLAANVARTLGGTLSARNLDTHNGAVVILTLPLATLRIESKPEAEGKAGYEPKPKDDIDGE
ncbi:MAG TPA: ATP-binding protein [Rhodocyclaceae bacterium]|nr:ATP-binding protein [Rhodocyclaceae bacterium]